MNTLKLNNGIEMPQEGFGVFQIPDPEECEAVTYNAIKLGYRLIDTAAAYGNEEAVGRGIRRAVADGLVTRDELFVQTKVWVQDQKTENDAYRAIETSLKKLGLDQLDSILLHQAMGDYFAAYRGEERALRDGLTRTIGVANFFPETLMNLCENVDVIPAINQIERHPFFTQDAALANMKNLDVLPQAWAPLAEGRHQIFTDPAFTAIGEKYGKTAAQVVLRWNIQCGVSIIPKSVHVDRMQQNLDIWDFELTDDEMAQISSRDIGHSEIINHYDPSLVKALNEMNIHA
jgi:diketogulonate reductase-like aldo/keto reductase